MRRPGHDLGPHDANEPDVLVVQGPRRATAEALVKTDVVGQPRPALHLPEHVRQAFSSRMMLQAPANLTERQIAAIRQDLDSRVAGLPPGAFMALDALRLLADAGNEVAKTLFDAESERLGLTRPFSSFRR